eukprot:16279612-Heterocapsa_arctica.AAC.1
MLRRSGPHESRTTIVPQPPGRHLVRWPSAEVFYSSPFQRILRTQGRTSYSSVRADQKGPSKDRCW